MEKCGCRKSLQYRGLQPVRWQSVRDTQRKASAFATTAVLVSWDRCSWTQEASWAESELAWSYAQGWASEGRWIKSTEALIGATSQDLGGTKTIGLEVDSILMAARIRIRASNEENRPIKNQRPMRYLHRAVEFRCNRLARVSVCLAYWVFGTVLQRRARQWSRGVLLSEPR